MIRYRDSNTMTTTTNGYHDNDNDVNEFHDDDNDFELTSQQQYNNHNNNRHNATTTTTTIGNNNSRVQNFDSVDNNDKDEQTLVPELYIHHINQQQRTKCKCYSLIVVLFCILIGTISFVVVQSKNIISKESLNDALVSEIDKINKWINATVTLNDGPNMYTILQQLPHNKSYFTEGLTYNNGYLYESIGIEGQSAIIKMDATTGTVLQQHTIQSQYFAEGITYYGSTNQLIQLTYTSQTGFIYNTNDITKVIQTFNYNTTTNEGWGITYNTNTKELIISDGSDYIHYWDPTTLQLLRKVKVRRQSPNTDNSNYINELEFYNNRILANVWYEDTIIVINPDTGIVEKEYDFSLLYPEDERDINNAGVLNGISISDNPDVIFVTGKNWDRMFRVQLNYPEQSTPATNNNDGNDSNQSGNDGTDDETKNTDDTTTTDSNIDNQLDNTTLEPTISPTPTNNDNDSEIQNWLDATVTLESGPDMYEIIEQVTHLSTSFTEGLTYNDGVFYESIGMNGQSAVLAIDSADTTTILQQTTMSSKYFGEGLAYRNGLLYQLTWKSGIGFIYNATNIKQKPEQFQFTTTRNEGWGLTYDTINDEFIVSDGSDYIHFWDPITMLEKRKVAVTRQNNKNAKNINELEFYRNRILANIWYEDTIIVINPQTGIVEKEYDFSQLWPLHERKKSQADVLNGISVSDDPDILYITGKYWDRMFRIRLKY